jgi:hypothetical protein
MTRAQRTAGFVLFLSMALVVGLEASARDVKLRWVHPDPASVDGYRVYYGTDSSPATWQPVEVPTPPQTEMDPEHGQVFVYELEVDDATSVYVGVTAYAGSLESELSNTQLRLGTPGQPTLVPRALR